MRRLLLVVLLLLLWTPAAQAWTWPVRGPVVEGFSFDKAHPYAAGQHRGIDIGSTSGGQVVAPASGIVTFAGSLPASGLCVTIATADGQDVTLTHLGSISVQRGGTIEEGASIGTVGPSGTPEVDGPYVHLGIRVASNPNGYLDPLSLLPSAGTPVSPSATPATAPAPASAQQQGSAGPAPPTAADSTTKTAASGSAPSATPGPPAAGAAAPVEVPAADFARHAVEASAKASSSSASRAVPAVTASAGLERRTVVVTHPPVRRTSAERARSRGEAAARRARRTHPETVSATPASIAEGASHGALVGDGGIHPIPTRRVAPAPPAAVVSRPATSTPARWMPSATLAGAALAPLLFLLGAVCCRRRNAPAAPSQEEAIVLSLPLPHRPEPLREHHRLAA